MYLALAFIFVIEAAQQIRDGQVYHFHTRSGGFKPGFKRKGNEVKFWTIIIFELAVAAILAAEQAGWFMGK